MVQRTCDRSHLREMKNMDVMVHKNLIANSAMNKEQSMNKDVIAEEGARP
jgi:hypothetical protein